MFKFFTIVAILVAAYIPQNLIALDAPAKVVEPTLEETILKYSTQYGSNPDVLYSVMMCESGGKWIKGDFRKDTYHSFGQFQYFTETWNRYSKQFGEELDINSAHDQIKLTAWVYSLGESQKSEWTTYVAIKKGGTYSFWSKFHQKNFTVKCPLKKLPV